MMAVKDWMKMEPLKEGRRRGNKGLAPHRHNTFEKLNLSLKKQEDFPPPSV